MKKQVLSAAIAALIGSAHVSAGDADVFVFLGNNPLQGVNVKINGETVGLTDASGEASSYLDQDGRQTIVLEKDGEQLLKHDFSLQAEQDAEISIVLSTDNEPSIDIYKSGEDASTSVGSLKGQVLSPNGSPLANATVRLIDTDFETATDGDGNFSFALPRGTYELSIYHPDYAAASYSDIRIVANIGTGAIVTLKEKSSSKPGVSVAAPDLDLGKPAEEVLVLGRFSSAQESSFTLEQMSTSVVDAIDIGEIQRLGDSDVGAIVQRVVGVSLVDGKYAVVRGLDGRYISATLNKNLMPTTNAFKRDAELDLFPADILGGLEIQKSFSADLPADSTAGTILIKTRQLPTDFTNKFSVSLGMTSGLTGDDILTYDGSDGDYWGEDLGKRELPGFVYSGTNGGLDLSVCQIEGQSNCVDRWDAVLMASSLPNVWNPETDAAPMEYSLSLTHGSIVDMAMGSWSIYGTAEFGKDVSSKQDAYLDEQSGNSGALTEDTLSTDLSAYIVTGFTFFDDSYIDSKSILLRNTDDTVRTFDGIDNSEGTQESETNLEWKEREYFGQYFSGFHYLFETHELDWRLGVSKTETLIPDRRSYRYQGDFLAISTVERLYGQLTEDGQDLGIDYMLPVDFNTSWRADIKLGYLYNQRERENEQVRLGYRSGPNVISFDSDMESLFTDDRFVADSLRLMARSSDTDSYNAEQELNAVYAAIEAHYTESVSLIAGVRQETFEQSLSFPNARNGESELFETDDLYPSLGLIYRPSDAWQLRLNASQTISRPTLTERAPARFYNEKGDEYIGNPDLESSDIVNLDFRVDYYFADQGNISVALFNKTIDRPVELGVVDGSGSASSALTWRNEKEATISGLEIDFNREYLDTGSWVAYAAANLSLIESEVELTDVSLRLQKDAKRDLQGQSPALGNLQLGFDHLNSLQKFTFLVNYFDDRIAEVDRKPSGVVYETGRVTVDFNYEIGLFDESATVKAKIKNLTNEEVEYTQDGRSIEGWKRGTEFSVGFSYNF